MLDPAIHQETRLRIVALLQRNGEVSARRACEALGLTPGNFGAHVGRLLDAGYVASRHGFRPRGVELHYRLTTRGEEAFAAYLAALRDLLGDPGPRG